MYRDPDEFSEYGEVSLPSKYYYGTDHVDYSHPQYYQQQGAAASPESPSAPPAPDAPYSAQPVQPLDSTDYHDPYAHDEPYAAYGNGNGAQPYEYNQAALSEYRGPATVEGYTNDVGVEQRDSAERGSSEIPAGGKRRRGLAGLGGIGATIGALLLKLQGFVFLFKFGLAGITALISIAVYSFFLGWPFAIGLVALLFLHEMGHAIVMKLKGIPVGNMIFIPMLGAAVSMKQMPQNARDEAEVGIAGPVAGAIASSVCLLIARMPLANEIWAPLAYFGFFMNLINLIPIVPFDGGRVLAAIDRRVWILGFIALLAFQIWSWLNGSFSFWLLIFVVMAAMQLWSRGTNTSTVGGKAYYDVPVSARITLSLLYFGLAAVLYLGMTAAHGMMVPVLN